MISTVLCVRLYKIFDSTMLHKNPSRISLRGIFRIIVTQKMTHFCICPLF